MKNKINEMIEVHVNFVRREKLESSRRPALFNSITRMMEKHEHNENQIQNSKTI